MAHWVPRGEKLIEEEERGGWSESSKTYYFSHLPREGNCVDLYQEGPDGEDVLVEERHSLRYSIEERWSWVGNRCYLITVVPLRLVPTGRYRYSDDGYGAPIYRLNDAGKEEKVSAYPELTLEERQPWLRSRAA